MENVLLKVLTRKHTHRLTNTRTTQVLLACKKLQVIILVGWFMSLTGDMYKMSDLPPLLTPSGRGFKYSLSPNLTLSSDVDPTRTIFMIS